MVREARSPDVSVEDFAYGMEWDAGMVMVNAMTTENSKLPSARIRQDGSLCMWIIRLV